MFLRPCPLKTRVNRAKMVNKALKTRVFRAKILKISKNLEQNDQNKPRAPSGPPYGVGPSVRLLK